MTDARETLLAMTNIASISVSKDGPPWWVKVERPAGVFMAVCSFDTKEEADYASTHLDEFWTDTDVTTDAREIALIKMKSDVENLVEGWIRSQSASVLDDEKLDTSTLKAAIVAALTTAREEGRKPFLVCICDLSSECHVLTSKEACCELCDGPQEATPEVVEAMFRAYEKRVEAARKQGHEEAAKCASEHAYHWVAAKIRGLG